MSGCRHCGQITVRRLQVANRPVRQNFSCQDGGIVASVDGREGEFEAHSEGFGQCFFADPQSDECPRPSLRWRLSELMKFRRAADSTGELVIGLGTVAALDVDSDVVSRHGTGDERTRVGQACPEGRVTEGQRTTALVPPNANGSWVCARPHRHQPAERCLSD